jgi:hypothetical protein
MMAGGALTEGTLFTINSSGRAAAVASGGVTLGRVMEAATADGDIITVLLTGAARQGGAI